ncbi:MAG: bifunctional diaminohydroxyphosphoribosylaminopyrimidine deaminase/5-amino-6-(5-phosphoribosylamino)uracil reductase RibD [Chlamydiales bacterium]|nr:bifunctional diaminohydroxyphosphoribosylaminopyrimidine deaminase/5-amino-6-(5-phosphoribosylamino)uracil reductase RibD [Chlamydiales bacterium]
MRWAIRLGEKGRITAPPNPWVGCVLVKEGEILGEGYHLAPGHPHAEAIALEKAGALAKGCTAYVSLEPCVHRGRTPPCAHALINAGVKKVVIPFEDPDPRVSGRGVKALERAGVEVVMGIAKEEAERSLRPYLHQRCRRIPFCVLKAAMSIDGRTAAEDGTSKWITSEEARCDVHLLRAQSQAILVGSETARLDRPRLTVRGFEVEQPLRVLIDSKGRVPPEGPLFDPTLAPTLVFTENRRWEKEGIEVIELPKITLNAILEELGRREVVQLLVEGGSALHARFLKERLADLFCLYIGNCLLGPQGRPLIPDLPVSTIEEAPRWALEAVHRFGDSLRLDYLFDFC